MTQYLRFLKVKMYLGFFMVLSCAMLGSVWGARKESKEPLTGVTQEDIQISQQSDKYAPELVGILPLAARQNKWYNFKYAVAFGLGGAVVYCVLMAGYQRFFQLHFFVIIRNCFGAEEGGNYLFVNLGKDKGTSA